ncbi:hypothetical protein ECE50_023400 [Chitinophaga sp. Mgbs1]|uniref:Uncharacterized protein n=1 Tax=Chitinophaga solisilvae TaxID=1233460 RepID=A0A433WAG2_9BACT|nr:hypothetical protein [Chitinophaga solisilvae]
MKKKISLNKKLFLQKETIGSLNSSQQQEVQGGVRTKTYFTAPTVPSPINCLCCYIPTESQNSPCTN